MDAIEDARKLIFIGGKWVFALRVPATGYGKTGADIWSDPITTGWICRVGQETAVADLPPRPSQALA